MSVVRITATPSLAASKPAREGRVVSRDAVRAVESVDSVEADRQRSLQEELRAAEERLPMNVPDEPPPDPHELADELGRLGAEAVKVLQPLSPRVRQLAETDHVDEEA